MNNKSFFTSNFNLEIKYFITCINFIVLPLKSKLTLPT